MCFKNCSRTDINIVDYWNLFRLLIQIFNDYLRKINILPGFKSTSCNGCNFSGSDGFVGVEEGDVGGRSSKLSKGALRLNLDKNCIIFNKIKLYI